MSKHIIVYDFETYWESKSYTLSKMSAIDYVRDPRFYAQLMAVSVDGKEPIVVEHEQIPACLDMMGLDNPNNILIGHNASGFDNLILSEVYGRKPACLLTDTMHLARWSGASRVCSEHLATLSEYFGVGVKGTGTVTSDGKRTKDDFSLSDWESFKEYCKQDVRLTFKIAMKMLPFMTKTALLFSSLTCKMATDPAFCINTSILQDYLQVLKEKEQNAKQSLMQILNLDNDVDFLKQIRSAKKFEALLRLLNVNVPMKLSEKRTASARKALEKDAQNVIGERRKQIEAKLADPTSYEVWVPALSKQDLEFIALQDHPDARVRELVKLRLDNNSSVPVTRTQALIHMGEYKKPVPILLKCFYAHTSRYGAGNAEGKSDSLNWQNFSKHQASMKPIRKSIVTPDGYAVVACDSSQVEARCVAYEAQQTDLLEQFAEHRDPYAELAAKFGVPYTAQEIHDGAKSGNAELKVLRNAAKRAVLSGGYGAGSQKYADSIWKDGAHLADDKDEHDAKAKPLHKIYRQSNPNIVAFWRTCSNVLNAMIAGESGTFGGPKNDLFTFGLMDMPNGDKIPSIKLPTGYILRYPNLRYEEDTIYYDRILGKNIIPTKIYGGALTENLTQSLAFQILIEQAVMMVNNGLKIHCNIHDSFATVVPEDKVDEIKELMLKCMRTVPAWVEGLPLDAEAEVAHDFTIV